MDSDPNKFATFSDAENSCKNMGQGAHLVSIVDAFESAFLKYYVKQWGKSDFYWVGLRSVIDATVNVTQVFEWTDDWPVYYTNWDDYEPQFAGLAQEECVNFAKSNGTWRTTMCATSLAYICKKSIDPLPQMESDKSGTCPQLDGNYDKSLSWVNLDKRSPFCYWFSVDRKGRMSTGVQTWADASFHCRRRNGSLASIHSTHEIMLMKNYLNRTGTYYNTWIGLSKDPKGL